MKADFWDSTKLSICTTEETRKHVPQLEDTEDMGRGAQADGHTNSGTAENPPH